MKRVNPMVTYLICLAVIHLVVLLAGFFSQYDFATQDRELPYCPPTSIHLVNKEGRPLWHPFVYRWVERVGEFQRYEEDQRIPYPFHALNRGGCAPDISFLHLMAFCTVYLFRHSSTGSITQSMNSRFPTRRVRVLMLSVRRDPHKGVVNL